MTFRAFILICLTLLLLTPISAQKLLRVNYLSFGIPKKFDYNVHEVFTYKLKGDLLYNSKRLLDFHDSIITFDNYVSVRFNDIKAIKVNHQGYYNKLFQRLFLYAGVGYVSLYTVNNLILGYRPVFEQQTLVISASLILTSFIIKQLAINRVNLKRKGFLKVLELNYNDLNSKQ